MRKPRGTPVVNVTPLVDVLIILLVVLLLAMPLYVKRLPVDLPQTSLAGTPTPIQAISISIGKNAEIYVQGVPDELDRVLSRITAVSTVELSVDKDVTYDVIARTLAQIQDKKPKEIVLLTR